MANYTLFGSQVKFSDSQERFIALLNQITNAQNVATSDFKKWYDNCGSIYNVLTHYESQVHLLVEKYALKPMYSSLLNIDIYEISESRYADTCLDLSDAYDVLDKITEVYENINGELIEKKEYRAYRKATRGRVVGGGFGVGGAIKGMATAGAMNAVTGMAHSAVNAVGNIGSSISASIQKSTLYHSNEIYKDLLNGMTSCISEVFINHIDLINSLRNNYYDNAFDIDKGDALFKNAITVVSKQKELLVESFKRYPWNEDLLEYIFINYRKERKNVWNICLHFDIDFQYIIEETFESSYTDEVKNSLEKTLEYRNDIVLQMKELGVKSSETLLLVETDYLRKIAKPYNIRSTEQENKEIIDKIDTFTSYANCKQAVIYELKIWELANKYSVKFSPQEIEAILVKIYDNDAKNSEELALIAKEKIQKIMKEFGLNTSRVFNELEQDCIKRLCVDFEKANEQACNDMLARVQSYEALEKNKAAFIQKLHKRIEEIWSNEDGAIFSNMYLNTDIYNPVEVEKTLEIIKKKARTNNDLKYITALSNCNKENINKAIKFQKKSTKICCFLGWLSIVLSIILWLNGDSYLVLISGTIFAYLFLSKYFKLKKVWNCLTINGTLIHRSISITGTEQRK